MSTLGWDPGDQIQISEDGDTISLEEALTSYFEITKLTKPLLQMQQHILIMKR